MYLPIYIYLHNDRSIKSEFGSDRYLAIKLLNTDITTDTTCYHNFLNNLAFKADTVLSNITTQIHVQKFETKAQF